MFFLLYFLFPQSKIQTGLRWAETHTEEGSLGDSGHIMGKCFKMGGGGKMVNATGTLGQEGSNRSLSQRRLM